VILHRHNKFYPNWMITDIVMTLCRFFKMAAYRRKYTSGRQRTICVLNFDQISQSTAKIILLPVAENKRLLYLNSTPDFKELFTVIGK